MRTCIYIYGTSSPTAEMIDMVGISAWAEILSVTISYAIRVGL